MRLPKFLVPWKKEEEIFSRPAEEYGEEEIGSRRVRVYGDEEPLATKSVARTFSSPRMYYAFFVLVLAVVVPVAVYLVVVSGNVDSTSELWTCSVKPEYRISCPNATLRVTEDVCMNLKCCWSGEDGTCYHSLPSQHSYKDENWDENTALTKLEKDGLYLKPRIPKCVYDNRNAVNLLARVVSTSEGSILRVYLYDKETSAPDDNKDTTPLNKSQFEVNVYGQEYFSVRINRSGNGTLLFSTSLGPTIACDDYWELALQFPIDAAVFGLGGLRLSSKPKVLYNNRDRLGANPFIMILDTEESTYGILFKNAGPMEFQLLENSNILSVKSRSRAMWDISVFAGPKPANVMEQYTSIEGLRPTLPPAWALGFHICRDTERNNGTLMADGAMDFLKKNATNELPYESDCLQEGLLYGMNFSISTNMTDIIRELENAGRKLLLSLPPHVKSSLANSKELFVLRETALLQEEFRGLTVSYPDFFNEEWEEVLCSKITNLQIKTEGILGGFVLQDNWPASTTVGNAREDIPVAEGVLSAGTLWWSYRHGNKSHYWVHNEYGLRHAQLVASCLNRSTELVLSTASHTGLGAVGGCHAHAQANVRATWDNMKTALETALGLGLAGIPLSGGGSVCGTAGDYDEELCVRWYQMSSMLPLMRVSSEVPLRDPGNFTDEFSRQAARDVLQLRYSLLSYFYSLFHEAKKTGVPVARPMFFEFPTDNQTWTINEQFMIGPALMANPVFYEGAVTVPVYLPKDTIWYHFKGGHQVNNDTEGVVVLIPSLKKELVLLLRGGFIVPDQKPELTVNKTLAGSYNLVVGLRCMEGGRCSASGTLNRDSEDSLIDLTFTAHEAGLVINGSCSSCMLQNVLVYGIRNSTNFCNVASRNNGATCTVKGEDGVIEINNLELNLSSSENLTIEWDFGTAEPTTDQPSTEEFTTDQTSTEEPTTDQTSTEESTTDQTSTEESTTDQTSTEESTTDQTSTEESTTDQTSTEESTSTSSEK